LLPSSAGGQRDANRGFAWTLQAPIFPTALHGHAASRQRAQPVGLAIAKVAFVAQFLHDQRAVTIGFTVSQFTFIASRCPRLRALANLTAIPPLAFVCFTCRPPFTHCAVPCPSARPLAHNPDQATVSSNCFKNPQTDYQNGIDWHVDLEASRFLSKRFYVGAVGYAFNQLTGDTGSGAELGPYISRISAVGPEVGYLFPVGGMQGSLNLRGYWEFAAQNRSSGWNTWLVFSIAPTAEYAPKIVK
jgi:Putative MetA-pathway of phenol degradation